MSKKRFTDGLNDLVNNEYDTLEVGVVDQRGVGSNAQPIRKSGGKRFVTTLDSLLAEVSEDPFFSEPRTGVNRPGKSKTTETSGYRAPVTGLDALIRQTLQVDHSQDDETKRRISVIVDRQKLDRLKTIARMEGAFMKDIITELIEEYVLKYSNDKGVEI